MTKPNKGDSGEQDMIYNLVLEPEEEK